MLTNPSEAICIRVQDANYSHLSWESPLLRLGAGPQEEGTDGEQQAQEKLALLAFPVAKAQLSLVPFSHVGVNVWISFAEG